LIASIGRCYYIQGIQEKQLGNLSCAKEVFEKSIGYYTKAMALDTQMNLHKYDNYADKLVKRSESHVELGYLDAISIFGGSNLRYELAIFSKTCEI
jgi:hypothetical protein